MTPPGPSFAQVVVDVAPAHLDHPFDYRVPDGASVRPGQRVTVRFSGRRRTGWVVGVADQASTDRARIQPLERVVGEVVWFDDEDLRLFRWVARRYGGTLADVLRHALPKRVASVETAFGQEAGSPPHPRGAGAERPAWDHYGAEAMLEAVRGGDGAFWLRALPGDDPGVQVVDLVERCLEGGRRALVLVPDPSSPVPDAVLRLAGDSGADLRPGGDRGRYEAFLRCRSGQAHAAVGERGAALTSLPHLGLVVVVDEPNPAYKERRSPRHHAREVALTRARFAGAACVLTGDLPSAQLWRLLDAGHVTAVSVDRDAEQARAPRVQTVDPAADRGPRTRLAHAAARAIRDTVGAGGVAVVLAARGGQGSALACRRCGRRRACPDCDSGVRPVRGSDGWECPTCGWSGPAFACVECRSEETVPLAAGAGRLAQELTRAHPDADVVQMEGFDAPGPTGRPAVAVMTRGSVVTRPRWLGAAPPATNATRFSDRGRAQNRAPSIALIIPDADAMLARPGLDAAEDALRLWMTVGHWLAPDGRIVLQTRHPGDHAIQAFVRWDPAGFWQREAERRAPLRFPPAASLIRIAAPVAHAPDIAAAVRAAVPEDDEVLGPDPAGATLVKTADLHATLDALTPLRHAWSKAGQRARVDVDPVD